MTEDEIAEAAEEYEQDRLEPLASLIPFTVLAEALIYLGLALGLALALGFLS